MINSYPTSRDMLRRAEYQQRNTNDLNRRELSLSIAHFPHLHLDLFDGMTENCERKIVIFLIIQFHNLAEGIFIERVAYSRKLITVLALERFLSWRFGSESDGWRQGPIGKLAPPVMRSCTTEGLSAASRALAPVELLAVMSATFFRSSLTTSSCPLYAALCRSVHPPSISAIGSIE